MKILIKIINYFKYRKIRKIFRIKGLISEVRKYYYSAIDHKFYCRFNHEFSPDGLAQNIFGHFGYLNTFHVIAVIPWNVYVLCDEMPSESDIQDFKREYVPVTCWLEFYQLTNKIIKTLGLNHEKT